MAGFEPAMTALKERWLNPLAHIAIKPLAKPEDSKISWLRASCLQRTCPRPHEKLWRCRKDSNPHRSTYSLLFRRQRWYGSKLLVGRPELESGFPSYQRTGRLVAVVRGSKKARCFK